jgi:uncharacterized membrane protein YqgA involved in biofilm formation
VIGTFLNASGIVAGGIAGLAQKTPLSAAHQNSAKAALGAFTAFFGLRLAWISLNGPFLSILKQLGIVLAALVAGKMAGRLLHLQKASNRLGQFARGRINASTPGDRDRFTSGFLTCSALFCAAPLGILGAVHDGLSGYYFPLAVKAAMDGLAAMGFVSVVGWGVALSAVPVFVFQGTLTLFCERFLAPFLEARQLVDPVNATGGLLIVCISLLIFDIRKIELTDYLPSLVFAPLLAWWLR